jgi:riboflavin kinase, archaea type
MIVKGIVRSGKGDFAYWLTRLANHYRAKLGVTLLPDTLNVHLTDQTYRMAHDALRLEKEEHGGTVSVSTAKCTFFGRHAFILRTDTDDGKLGDPPEAILEIASDLHLRREYGLKARDIVEVDVPQ